MKKSDLSCSSFSLHPSAFIRRGMRMFTDGSIEGIIEHPLAKFDDQRGWLVEIFRIDDLDPEYAPVMAYVSETLPGVVRGPHEHVDQSDNFAFIGPSNFEVYLWDNRKSSPTFRNRMSLVLGIDRPASLTVPPGVVHAYKNVGDVPGWVINFPNRLFRGEGKSEPVDEIRHEQDQESPFIIF